MTSRKESSPREAGSGGECRTCPNHTACVVAVAFRRGSVGVVLFRLDRAVVDRDRSGVVAVATVNAQPVLAGFNPPTHRIERAPRKLARAVSKETYNVLADTGMLGSACTKVLRSLKAYINRWQTCPTPAELTREMFGTGVIKRDDTRLVAPRITEMSLGKIVYVHGERVRVGCGEIELLPIRRCAVTGMSAHPIRPREKGSEAPR